MTYSPTPSAPTPVDRLGFGALVVCVAMVGGTYLFIGNVLSGGWLPLILRIAGSLIALVLYFGILYLAGRGLAATGRGPRSRWLLVVFPVAGAIAGMAYIAVVPFASPGRGDMIGAWYGLLHALYVWWWWRRIEARVGSVVDLHASFVDPAEEDGPE
jgi:hypothetical protein